MENMQCLVCNKFFINKQGVIGHIFKVKDIQHIEFVNNQNRIIDTAYNTNISALRLSTEDNCWMSIKYICDRWKTHTDYKERKTRLYVAHMNDEWTKYKTGKKVRRICRERFKKAHPIVYDKIILAFHGTDSRTQIAKDFSVHLKTIKKIWIKEFGQEAYEERCTRTMQLTRGKTAKSMDKARFIGSKNEIMCYTVLKKLLPIFEVKHHDYAIVPRLELDITIPLLKIAITWDGPGHRRPIFGDKAFARILKNDHIREETLILKDWRQISVADDGCFDSEAVAIVCDKIITLIQSEWIGKQIIFICGINKIGDKEVFDAELEEKYRSRKERMAKIKTLKNNIIQEFSLNLGIGAIAKKLGCWSGTVSALWRKTFGNEAVEQRKHRLLGHTLENIEKIIEHFYSDLSIENISKTIGVSEKFIIKTWQKQFGIDAINERNKHMIHKGRPLKNGEKDWSFKYELI